MDFTHACDTVDGGDRGLVIGPVGLLLCGDVEEAMALTGEVGGGDGAGVHAGEHCHAGGQTFFLLYCLCRCEFCAWRRGGTDRFSAGGYDAGDFPCLVENGGETRVEFRGTELDAVFIVGANAYLFQASIVHSLHDNFREVLLQGCFVSEDGRHCLVGVLHLGVEPCGAARAG